MGRRTTQSIYRYILLLLRFQHRQVLPSWWVKPPLHEIEIIFPPTMDEHQQQKYVKPPPKYAFGLTPQQTVTNKGGVFSDSLPKMQQKCNWWLLRWVGGSSKTCPFFGGFHNPTPPTTKVYVTSTPGQVDRRFRVLGRGLGSDKVGWLLGIRRVGPKKPTKKHLEDLNLWWMICFFVFFSNVFYFTLIMRIWFVDFVSNDLVGWNTWPDLPNSFLVAFPTKKSHSFGLSFSGSLTWSTAGQHILHSPLQSLDDWDP